MNRILCAIDYSDNAITALQYAVSIGEQTKADLSIIHVMDIPTYLNTKEHEPVSHLEQDALNQDLKKLYSFCENHVGDKVHRDNILLEIVEDTSVVNGIVTKADKDKVFMIVVGMKGTSGIKEMIMGSVAKQLIDRAHCLVLAVPLNASFETVKTIVYATDFEADADVEVIKKISGLAKVLDAKIQVVHVSTDKAYSGETQMKWLNERLLEKVEYPNINLEVVHAEDVFNTLTAYLNDINADMVCMLEREEIGLLKKIFHRDLVKRMESFRKIPLVSFNEKNFGMFHFIEF